MPETRIILLHILPRGEGFANAKDRISDVYIFLTSYVNEDRFSILDVSTVITCHGMSTFPRSYFDQRWRTGRAPSPCRFYEDDLLHISADGYSMILDHSLVNKINQLNLRP